MLKSRKDTNSVFAAMLDDDDKSHDRHHDREQVRSSITPSAVGTQAASSIQEQALHIATDYKSADGTDIPDTQPEDNYHKDDGNKRASTARTRDTDFINSLFRASDEERHDAMKAEYSNTYQNLEYLDAPPVCELAPEHSRQILACFFEYTTFRCTVWINYDPVEHEFYFDKDRLELCGKVRVSNSVRVKLLQFEAAGHAITKIQLLIRTPFRLLATMDLRFDRKIGVVRVVPRLAANMSGNWRLEDFIKRQAAQLQRSYMQSLWQPFFTMGHMDKVASLFKKTSNWS